MKTKTLIWILLIWLLSLAIMMLVSGCKTKTVTEYVAVHDTTLISKTDTCYKVKTEYSHDTLRVEVEKIVTLNEGGDTIRLEVYKDRWRDRWNIKTDTLVKVKSDTVYISKDNEHEKTVTKKASWWSIWKWRLTALVALCALILLLWHGYKDRIKKWLKR